MKKLRSILLLTFLLGGVITISAQEDAIKEQTSSDSQNNLNNRNEFYQKNKAIEKRLIAKYGRKAYEAMENFNPYIGIPEGIIRNYSFYTNDGYYFQPWAFSHIKNGYKVYVQTKGFKSLLWLSNMKAPKVIYARNGRVTDIKW